MENFGASESRGAFVYLAGYDRTTQILNIMIQLKDWLKI